MLCSIEQEHNVISTRQNVTHHIARYWILHLTTFSPALPTGPSPLPYCRVGLKENETLLFSNLNLWLQQNMTSPDERRVVVFLDLWIFLGMIPLLRLKTTDEDEAHSEQYYKSPTKNKKKNNK